MGTRSLVHFYNEPFEDREEKIITSIYRQMDGYYDGRGIELATFLSRITLVDGITMGQGPGTHANGMGCLAAQWIEFEKDNRIGNVYLNEPQLASKDDIFIEYEYEVRAVDGELELTTRGHEDSDLPFKGSPADFDPEILKKENVA